MNKGRVLSINLSEKTGEQKTPTAYGRLEKGGFVGDAHFGKDDIRQVSILSDESARKLHPLGVRTYPGIFAENITTTDISITDLKIGDKLKIGDVLMEVSKIGKECHKGCAIKQQAGFCVMPTDGIFARVIDGGEIRIGDSIEVLK